MCIARSMDYLIFFAPNNGFAGLTCRDKYKLHSHLSNATSTTTIAATTARLEF
jgi:hypothetical protein